MTDPLDPWTRLGDLLKARRVELDPSFKSRERFAAATGLNERLIADLENGRRTRYRDTTVHAVEAAYRWAPGSFEKVLQGGQPSVSVTATSYTALTSHAAAESRSGEALADLPADVDPTSIPRREVHLWRTPDLSERERAILIGMVRAMRNEVPLSHTMRTMHEALEMAEQAEKRRNAGGSSNAG